MVLTWKYLKSSPEDGPDQSQLLLSLMSVVREGGWGELASLDKNVFTVRVGVV